MILCGCLQNTSLSSSKTSLSDTDSNYSMRENAVVTLSLFEALFNKYLIFLQFICVKG